MDTGVANLAAACHSLIHVEIEGSKYLTYTSLIAFFTATGPSSALFLLPAMTKSKETFEAPRWTNYEKIPPGRRV